jgi:membrane fusion protein (multidrug efflux system)
MIKQNLILILIIAIIFGGLFGFKFFQIKQGELQKQPPPPAVIAVTEVKQDTWQPSLEAVGTLVAVSGVDVSNEIAGKVTAIHFQSGQTVEKSQLLLELDSETDRAELKGLLAEQKLATIRFQRMAKLIRDKYTSQSEYDQSNAQLTDAKAAVESKQAILKKKQIKAPFSGELGIRQVNLGQYLAPGSIIVSLQNRNPIYVDFSIPERYLGELGLGQFINLNVQAYPEQSFEGKVTAINPGIDIETRSVKIRAILQNPDNYLRPGMFATVKVLSNHQTTVLTLPDTAITFNPYGNSVFVVKNEQQGLTVQNRQVETGMVRDGRVEVISGLNIGVRVVSAGQIKLRNGMQIIIDKKPAPGEREASE